MIQKPIAPSPLVLKDQPSPRLDWLKWEQKFSQYAAAINLTNEPPQQQVHIFLKTIGPEANTVFNNFNLTPEERLNLALIKDKFTEHFNRHLVEERYRFHRLYQRPYINFQSFLNSVILAADSCEFGEMKEEFIRDKLVVSIDCFKTRAKLLREPNLTMQKAIEICRRELIHPRQTYQQWQQSRKRRNENKYKYQLGNKVKSYSHVESNLKTLVKNELGAEVKTEQVTDAANVKTQEYMTPANIKQEPEEINNTTFEDAEMRIMLEIDNLVKEIGAPPQDVSEKSH